MGREGKRKRGRRSTRFVVKLLQTTESATGGEDKQVQARS
jgi:hypothetical protein